MIVSNRQRKILEVLLNRKEATAGEIAEEIQISARTVHRDIRELKSLLADYGLAIATKSGKGMSIQGSDEDLAKFQRMLAHFETVAFAPEERKTLIQCLLLEAFEPIKLFTLANELHAAIPTISRDLDEIEPQLAKYGVELIRRRGYGVEITGPESGKRSLIEGLATQYLDESDLFGPAPESEHAWPVTRQLLHLAGKEHFLAMERLVWRLEEKWPGRLSEHMYTRLLLQLSIAAARMQSGHWLELRPPAALERGSPAESTVSRDLEPFLEEFPWKWPPAERVAVQQLLDSARAEAERQSERLVHQNGVQAAETAASLIRSASAALNMPFDQDDSLLDGLARHLAPALGRMARGEMIRNPLLPQIRKDFASLFAAIRECADETFPSLNVPDEEIGYLVMHFGASAERLNLLRPMRALIVCTSGIGSSKLLSVRIAKEFPQVEFIGHYSWYEASRIPKEQYDLIISTVDLPIEASRYVKISPLMTSEETERLRNHLSRLFAGSGDTARAAELRQEEGELGWERMKLMNDYTTAVVSVLEPFGAYTLEAGPDGISLENAVAGMLRQASAKGGLKDVDVVKRQLLEREIAGSQALSGTQLALFHTRSDVVERPILQLFALEEPLLLGDDGSAEVRLILLMLAPLEIGRSMLEVLSEISAMLLQPEFVQLLEQGDADAIKRFMSRELEEFIESKWRGREIHEHIK